MCLGYHAADRQFVGHMEFRGTARKLAAQDSFELTYRKIRRSPARGSRRSNAACATLVIDPHADRVLTVESDDHQTFGAAAPLDARANTLRKRCRPDLTRLQPKHNGTTPNTVELAL